MSAHLAPLPRVRWRQRLHVRAGLMVLALWVLVGAGVYALVDHHQSRANLEAMQRLHLGLARYVIDHQTVPLIGRDGVAQKTAVSDVAKHVMMVNPAVELYLLSPQGRVLAHAIESADATASLDRRVDLGKVAALLVAGDGAGGSDVRLPVMGDDPRRPGHSAMVSVASLGPATSPLGFVYIVLREPSLGGVPATLANSETLRSLAGGVMALILAAALTTWLAFRFITRPLSDLSDAVANIRPTAASDQALGLASDSNDAGDVIQAADAPRPPVDEMGVLRLALAQLQGRIDAQFRQIEAGRQQQRELVSNISHDLRTPLSNIRAYVETSMMRETTDTRERERLLQTALRHVQQLDKRVNDLFELSKLDAPRMVPLAEVFCLAELLQDVVQNYQREADLRHIRLRLADVNHGPQRVKADIALIERVLQNLVDNALRYTPEGGDVTLAIEDDGDRLRVIVQDTGRGISKEEMPFMFERYWRASGVRDLEPASSAGLGLAIVKRILELHGTVLRVQSELARGTAMAFTLPRASPYCASPPRYR